MKGAVVIFDLLISFVIVLTLITSGLLVWSHLIKSQGVIDRFSSPVNWDKFLVEATGQKVFNKVENFLDEVSYVLPIDQLERKCSLWYRECTADLEKAPQSPWTKLTVSEADLNAMNYLKFDCAPEEIEELRKEWARKNSYFDEKDEYEQQDLIKNACGATIIEKINK